jgi:hypothetical protein
MSKAFSDSTINKQIKFFYIKDLRKMKISLILASIFLLFTLALSEEKNNNLLNHITGISRFQ